MPSAAVILRTMPTADSPSTQPRGSTTPVEDQGGLTTLSLRRAPKVSVFLSTGAVIGLLAGIIIGMLGSGSVEFTTAQVIGYMAVIFALLGMALGAVAYVIADRLSVRRARDVQARMESHSAAEDRREPVAQADGERSGAAPNDRSADVGD